MFGLRFDYHPIANQVQRLLLCGPAPAILRGAGLGLNDGVEGVLPRSAGDTRITSGQIGHCDLEIELRLPDGFVAGVEQGGRFGAVFCTKAFLLSRDDVFDVERAAELAAIENEPTFHRLRLFVQRYETARGRGCIRYTRRAANPVISSSCRVIPVR